MTAALPDTSTTRQSLEFFVLAYVFFILGITGLCFQSKALSLGDWSHPGVLGFLHFITLGWLCLSIFGALRVFTGVALGSSGYLPKLSPFIRYLWSAGALIFPLGLILNQNFFIVIGVSLLGVALVLFTVHMVPPLIYSARANVTRWFLVIAVASLWGTWFLGFSAAALRAQSPIFDLPQSYLPAHILLAIFGWVGSTIIGVGAHLIPMFALSKKTSDKPIKLILLLWPLVPALALIGAYFGSPYIESAILLAAIGSLLWLLQVVLYLRARLRRENDPGILLATISTFNLMIAWSIYLSRDDLIMFAIILIVGWLSFFTLGIFHRIVPFLVWFARFAHKKQKQGPVIKVQDLISARLAFFSMSLLLIGYVLWIFGLVLQVYTATLIGSIVMSFAVIVCLGQIKFLIKKVDEKPNIKDVLRKKGFSL